MPLAHTRGMIQLILAAALASAPHGAATVTIDQFLFKPATLTITAGESVRFVNRDQEAHTVTSRDKAFDSGGLDTGDAWTYRFTKTGHVCVFLFAAPVHDRQDRRCSGRRRYKMKRGAFLEHVAWTGTGIAYTLTASGLFMGSALGQTEGGDVNFVQISDSHIGFHQAANPDVEGTLRAAVAAINALPQQPAFVVHTGDVTHLSKPEQFTTAKDILSTLRAPLVVLPGEHDFIGSDHQRFFDVFPADDKRSTWRSWDRAGVHYVVLINVFDFENMGLLGTDQLTWLEQDLRAQKNGTPIVVFTHVPLYALYPQWGWTTQDGAKALSMLRRFDHVTVLNGHIHQVVRYQEGTITFASANATAYPQPAPGKAPKPGPLTLPHAGLLQAIGYRQVELHANGTAAIGDRTLG